MQYFEGTFNPRSLRTCNFTGNPVSRITLLIFFCIYLYPDYSPDPTNNVPSDRHLRALQVAD